MKPVIYVPLTMISIGLGCAKTNNKVNSSTDAIFDKDDRKVFSEDSVIRKAVGYLSPEGQNGVSCNGYFNSEKTIRTAKHCFKFDNGTKKIENLSFYTIEGKYKVTAISKIWEKADVLELEVNRNNASFLEEASLSINSPLEIYSYGSNKILLTNIGSLFTDYNDGTFSHQLDTVGSSSGSVLVQNKKAVGMHIGALYSDATKTKFSSNIGIKLSLLNSKSSKYNFATLDRYADSFVEECPEGQRDVCVLHRPFGGCAQSVCAPIPDWVPLPPTPPTIPDGFVNVGGVVFKPKPYDPDSDQVRRFAICINMPSAEAATCLSMVMGCFPAAAAAGIGYPVCIVASCGAAGAAQVYRCAKETEISP
ncbi:MAG: hypothetical protein HQK54_15150 [Oligoflexales bacterium]|nr:hypothetical protein [Oligoflexales bacterium]